MSRLRRDRQAMKWARYSRRNEKVAGHPGDVKESRMHWKHLGWLLHRKAGLGQNIHDHNVKDEQRWWQQNGQVIRLFHP